jgi:hypothetical protein
MKKNYLLIFTCICFCFSNFSVATNIKEIDACCGTDEEGGNVWHEECLKKINFQKVLPPQECELLIKKFVENPDHYNDTAFTLLPFIILPNIENNKNYGGCTRQINFYAVSNPYRRGSDVVRKLPVKTLKEVLKDSDFLRRDFLNLRPDLSSDIEAIQLILSKNIGNICDVNENIIDNPKIKEIILKKIETVTRAETLENERFFVLVEMQVCKSKSKIWSDESIAKAVLKGGYDPNGENVKLLNEKLFMSKEFLKWLFTTLPHTYKYLPVNIRDESVLQLYESVVTKDVIRNYFKFNMENGYGWNCKDIINYMSKNLKSDKPFMREMVKLGRNCSHFLPEDLRRDDEFMYNLIQDGQDAKEMIKVSSPEIAEKLKKRVNGK